MKFVCLAREDESVLDALSRSDWDRLRRETLDYVEELRESGRLLSAEPLGSARTAATVRVRGGRVSVIDGPFAEAKETVGGFFVIEAADRDEAIGIAARWPSARFGSIEVRPLEPGLAEERRYT